MPKRSKGGTTKPSRVAPVSPKPNGHSLIIRSAESLGRMIGVLQRQLEEIAVRARDGGKPVKKRLPLEKATGSRKTPAKGKPRNTQGKTAGGVKGG
jgi:hypothetical protein